MVPVQAGGTRIGGGPLVLIAGPCVIESESHAVDTAMAVRDIARAAGVPFIFKVSFDKANRTSVTSYRGPGLAEGLRILGRVRERAGVSILTDIHEGLDAIERSYADEWARTFNSEERDNLWRSVQVVRKLKSHFGEIVSAGTVATHQLTELKRLK